MNKKIGFVFLVLLCSLNIGMLSANDACVFPSTKTGELVVRVVKLKTNTYEVTIKSYYDKDIVISSFIIPKQDRASYPDIVWDENMSTIKARGQLKFTITYSGKAVALDASQVEVNARLCGSM